MRGEALVPWGVAEAQQLGIYDLLCETCGHKARWFDLFLGPAQIMHRDLESTTPRKTTVLTFYHPDMQEILISGAAKAGAIVARRAKAMPLIAQDPTRVPDHGISGPDIPFDKETARARFFGDV